MAASCPRSEARPSVACGRRRRAPAQDQEAGGDHVAERDRWLGPEVPLVTASGHARHDNQARFERQLDTVIAGIAVRLGS